MATNSRLRVKSTLLITAFLISILLIGAKAETVDVELSSSRAAQGSLITIEAHSDLAGGEILINGASFPFYQEEENSYAVLPLSYWWNSGDYTLTIVDSRGRTWLKEDVTLLPGKFEESYLTVSEEQEELVRPSDPNRQARLERDQKLVKQARAGTTSTRYWNEPFIWPLEGRVTTSFGATRYHNEKMANRHNGIDIAAPTGSPVAAANRGKVTLAADLLATGKTIIIDHGWNIYSSYLHLSALEVSAGDIVEQGETIGLVGSTGFSTGPHLHWSLSYNRIFLNPEDFVKLEL
ncbi:MAG: M23 family metallopeptidase [Bacillota bacterium]